MEKKSQDDTQLNIDDILNNLDTITKMHSQLDELSLQLSDVVHLAGEPSRDQSLLQASTKLMELVNVLLDKVELGINKLEHRVSTFEDIKNRLHPQDVKT